MAKLTHKTAHERVTRWKVRWFQVGVGAVGCSVSFCLREICGIRGRNGPDVPVR